MIFFTLLIGVCVAIQSGILKPVAQQKSVVSLIETAKNDPHALIQMLEGADDKTLGEILDLLNALRTESIGEQKRLQLLLATATKKLADATTEARRLEAIKIKMGTAKSQADREFNLADGKWKETVTEYNDGKPRLDKEIEVFTKVLNILGNLLDGQPQPKALLELGLSAQGQAYQKIIENIKADPEKLKKVIGLVNKLFTQSKDELKLLKDTMQRAKMVRDAKERTQAVATASYKAATAAHTAQTAVVQQAQGALTEAQKEYNTNYPIVSKERATIEEVIKILSNMRKAKK